MTPRHPEEEMPLREQLAALGACPEALEWVAGRTLEECLAAEDLPPDWIALALARLDAPLTRIMPPALGRLPEASRHALDAALYAMVDRAARVYVADAMSEVGLQAHAATLRALPAVADFASARVARRACTDAGEVAFLAMQSAGAGILTAENVRTSKAFEAAYMRAAKMDAAVYYLPWAPLGVVGAAEHIAGSRAHEERRLQRAALLAVAPLDVLKRALADNADAARRRGHV